MLSRTVAELAYPHAVRVRRIPSGALTMASVSEPIKRRGRQVAMVRFENGDYALALSSETPVWQWPTDEATPFTVMLYRASADRPARKELRRLLDPQRRDALYKAELLPA